jgi:hypothetical protein
MTTAVLHIFTALRLVKDVIEIALVGVIAYGIASGGPLDTRPVALALLVLVSIAIDTRDHLRRALGQVMPDRDERRERPAKKQDAPELGELGRHGGDDVEEPANDGGNDGDGQVHGSTLDEKA